MDFHQQVVVHAAHTKNPRRPGVAGNGDVEIGCYMVSIGGEPRLFTQGKSTGELAILGQHFHVSHCKKKLYYIEVIHFDITARMWMAMTCWRCKNLPRRQIKMPTEDVLLRVEFKGDFGKFRSFLEKNNFEDNQTGFGIIDSNDEQIFGMEVESDDIFTASGMELFGNKNWSVQNPRTIRDWFAENAKLNGCELASFFS
ncbi:MAG: hypothetical protein J6X55_09455 [Victivallales bacterium]|nr:hypothetical protein [Victivallales bacterium]